MHRPPVCEGGLSVLNNHSHVLCIDGISTLHMLTSRLPYLSGFLVYNYSDNVLVVRL